MGVPDLAAIWERFAPFLWTLARRTPDPEEAFGTFSLRLVELVGEYDPERGVPLDAYLRTKLQWTRYRYCQEFPPAAGALPARLYQVDTVEPDLEEAVQRLPERERRIIIGRYLDGRAHAEIAKDEGITRERVGKIERRALQRLKEWMRDE